MFSRGKEAEKEYQSVATSFDHLQDNYKLLQPLYRTTGKIRNIITGDELKDYIHNFFATRLADNQIKFTISGSGKNGRQIPISLSSSLF